MSLGNWPPYAKGKGFVVNSEDDAKIILEYESKREKASPELYAKFQAIRERNKEFSGLGQTLSDISDKESVKSRDTIMKVDNLASEMYENADMKLNIDKLLQMYAMFIQAGPDAPSIFPPEVTKQMTEFHNFVNGPEGQIFMQAYDRAYGPPDETNTQTQPVQQEATAYEKAAQVAQPIYDHYKKKEIL